MLPYLSDVVSKGLLWAGTLVLDTLEQHLAADQFRGVMQAVIGKGEGTRRMCEGLLPSMVRGCSRVPTIDMLLLKLANHRCWVRFLPSVRLKEVFQQGQACRPALFRVELSSICVPLL